MRVDSSAPRLDCCLRRCPFHSKHCHLAGNDLNDALLQRHDVVREGLEE
jgi:hypothetical protein